MRERRRSLVHLAEWVRRKDPGLLAIKRSVRAAVIMPAVFGLTHALFSNPQVSLLGALGSFALLLLVDFPGRPRTRLFSFVLLWLIGSGLIALGTVVSTHKWVSVGVMAVVGFAVLFAGIVSPQAAAASTATLLIFVLPVAVAQPASAIGPRLLGWACAAVVCITACMVVWPTPWHDNLRRRLSATVGAMAELALAQAEGIAGSRGGRNRAGRTFPPAGPVRGYAVPAHRCGRKCGRPGQARRAGRMGRRQCDVARRRGGGAEGAACAGDDPDRGRDVAPVRRARLRPAGASRGRPGVRARTSARACGSSTI